MTFKLNMSNFHVTFSLFEALEQYLSSLEQTHVGGRKLSALHFDLNTKRVDMTFEDADPEVQGSLLAYYESAQGELKRECEMEFSSWKVRHLWGVTQADYRERSIGLLHQLFQSDFLQPKEDLLNREILKQARGELEKMGMAVEMAPHFALLCLLTKREKECFSFDDTSVLERYLQDHQDRLSPKSMSDFFRFKYSMELVAPFLAEDAPKGTRNRVKPQPDPKPRTKMTFQIVHQNTTLAHFNLIYGMICSEGWMEAGQEQAFLDLFSGQPSDCVLVWLGKDKEEKKVGVGTLKTLFAEMIRQKVISCPNNEYVALIEAHFQDESGQYLKNVKGSGGASQKTAPIVNQMVGLLKMGYEDLLQAFQRGEFRTTDEAMSDEIEEDFEDVRYTRREYYDEHYT